MKTSKGFSHMIVVLLVAVLLGTGMYFLLQSKSVKVLEGDRRTALDEALNNGQQQSDSEPNGNDDEQPQEVNPTADWKTYASGEHGFEFKYPSGWIETTAASDDIILFINTNTLTDKDERLILSIDLGRGLSAGAASANAQELEDQLKTEGLNYTKQTINVGGVNSTKFIFTSKIENEYKIYHRREVVVYIPDRGLNGNNFIIGGACDTYIASNSEHECSSDIDDIMNNIVIPSFKFN